MDIEFASSTRASQGRANDFLPRWSYRKLDIALLEEAASLQGSSALPDRLNTVHSMAEWLCTQMQQLCDLTMLRVRRPLLSSVFWWNEDLAALCRISVRCSRQFTRARRRGAGVDELAAKYDQRKQARHAYKLAIRKAKALAWDQLLATVNGDPWGKPYLIVMGRLRAAMPSICETLAPELLERVLATLFPRLDITQHSVVSSDVIALDVPPEITSSEFTWAIKRLHGPIKAPGPDGINGRIWLVESDRNNLF